MVDKDHIHSTLMLAFNVIGEVEITDDGIVNVTGSVTTRTDKGYWRFQDHDKIPVEFGIVTKDFDVESCGLTTLHGSPREVGWSLWANGNKLENLMGGPEKVSGSYWAGNNPIKTLEGLATIIGKRVEVPWNPHVPLLRCLVAPLVDLYPRSADSRDVANIMNDLRWVGKGKKGSLMCAAALIKAGLEGNAKW